MSAPSGTTRFVSAITPGTHGSSIEYRGIRGKTIPHETVVTRPASSPLMKFPRRPKV